MSIPLFHFLTHYTLFYYTFATFAVVLPFLINAVLVMKHSHLTWAIVTAVATGDCDIEVCTAV